VPSLPHKFTESVPEIDNLMVQATGSTNKDIKNAVSHVKKIRADYRTGKKSDGERNSTNVSQTVI
jgi:hypothetical protein